MTRKFEFKNNNLKLDIAGNEFEIDVADECLIQNITGFADKAMKFSNKLSEEAKKEDADYGKALKDAIEFVLGTINMVLGEDASKKIFENRKVSFFDALDVMDFIINEYNNARKKNFSKYSPNRAQRRAAK